MSESNDPTLLFVLEKKPSTQVQNALLSISDALEHRAGYAIITIAELQKSVDSNSDGQAGSNLDVQADSKSDKRADSKSNKCADSKLGEALAAYIEKTDPWSVVALDKKSIDTLSSAFANIENNADNNNGEHPATLKPDKPIEVCGYKLVAVPDFESCLDDEDQKRIAWKRLKAAAHPKNPLD